MTSRAYKERINLSMLSSLLKRFALRGEDTIRQLFAVNTMVNLGKASHGEVEDMVQALGKPEGLEGVVLCYQMTGAIAGECAVTIDEPDIHALLDRTVLMSSQVGMASSVPAVEAVGELLLRWLRPVTKGIANFLEEEVELTLLSIHSYSDLGRAFPCASGKGAVLVPMEWSFSDAQSVLMHLWLEGGLAAGLVDKCVHVLQTGRSLAAIDARESLASSPRRPVQVYPFRLKSFSSTATDAEAREIEVLEDVSLEVVVEIGRTTRTIGDILEWEEGTVITLNKLAGESVEVFINGSTIARGEVMVLDGVLSLRVTELVDPSQYWSGVLSGGQ